MILLPFDIICQSPTMIALRMKSLNEPNIYFQPILSLFQKELRAAYRQIH